MCFLVNTIYRDMEIEVTQTLKLNRMNWCLYLTLPTTVCNHVSQDKDDSLGTWSFKKNKSRPEIVPHLHTYWYYHMLKKAIKIYPTFLT